MTSFNCDKTDASCPNLYESNFSLSCKAPFYSAEVKGFVHVFNEKKTLSAAVHHCQGKNLQFYSLDQDTKRKEAENWLRYPCETDGVLIDRLSDTYHGGLRTLNGIGKWMSGESFSTENHFEWFKNGLSPSKGCQVCYFHASDETPLGDGGLKYTCGDCNEKHSFFCLDSPNKYIDEQQTLLLPSGESIDSDPVCDNLFEKALYVTTPGLFLLLIAALIYVIIERRYNTKTLQVENDNQQNQESDDESFEQINQSEKANDDIVLQDIRKKCVDGNPSGKSVTKDKNIEDQRKVSDV